MTQDQIEVKAIKQICPKYDKSLHSKCKDPNKYGVKRTTQAEAAKKGCSVKKTENRKLPLPNHSQALRANLASCNRRYLF